MVKVKTIVMDGGINMKFQFDKIRMDSVEQPIIVKAKQF